MATAKATATKGVVIDLDKGGDTPDDPKEILRRAKAKLATESAVIAYSLGGMAVVELLDSAPTMQVVLGADGIIRLQVNPTFARKLGIKGCAFVLSHEMYHVLYRHLYVGSELSRDELFTLACEIVINDRVMIHLRESSLPLVDGEPSGVDPQYWYKKYREARRDKGEEPVSYKEFVSSDLSCRSYLAEIPNPPKPKSQDFCQHKAGGAGSQGAGQQGQPGPGDQLSSGINPEMAGQIVGDVLDSLMTSALRGDKAAADALLELGEQVGEEHPLWGNLGLGQLRGEATPTAQVSFWEYFLTNALQSRTAPGARMCRPRKMEGLSPLFRSVGGDVPFLPVGEEKEANVAIAIDTSGSMPQALIGRVAKLVGTVPNARVHWLTFDADAYEIGCPSEGLVGTGTIALKGGGGTDFGVVQRYVEEFKADEDFDAVIVLTDGCAPPIAPANPDRWIWLLTTEHRNLWSQKAGMETIEVPDL